MSKYVLVPVENVRALMNELDENHDNAFKDFNDMLAWVDSGVMPTLNPENLIMMTSALLQDLPKGDNPVGEKVLKFLWPIVTKELKDKKVL